MAATTISNNKPTAGSISWTAFSMAYNGVTYGIPASSSAARFVWWEYNGGRPNLRSGDVLPELTADDCLLFLNKGGIGLLLPETTVLDGSLIVPESIYAGAIAADQIGTKHLQADSVTSDQIMAGAVTAEQLSVGSVSNNLIANGSFEDTKNGEVVGWQANSLVNGAIQTVTGVASSGSVAVQFDAKTTGANLKLGQKPEQYIPVSNASGRKWYVSARMGVGTAISKGAYIRVSWLDANKVWISNSDVKSNIGLTTTFTVYDGQATPPATARWMAVEIILTAPNVITKMYVDEVNAQEVIVAANIGDGQISTAKLAAKAVTADKMVIRDTTNFLIDGGFEANGAGWTLGTGNTVVTLAAADTYDGAVGTKVLQLVGNGTIKETTSDAFAVAAGDWYYASCWMRATVPSTSTGTVGLAATITIDGAGNQYPDFKALKASQITPEWMLVEGELKVPPKALSMSIRAQVRNNVADGTYQFDDVILRRMNGGELIVDGAIKTVHMTANTISGTVIAADTIVGSKIAADAITSRELLASEIWANSAWITAITGKRIVGASIGTESAVNRGVQITTANGLQVFDTAGTQLLRADKSGISAEGSFSATATNGKVELSATLPGEAVPDRYNAGLEFSGANNSYQGRIYSGYGIQGILAVGQNSQNRLHLSDAFANLSGRDVIVRADTKLTLAGAGGVFINQGSTAIAERRVPLGVLSHWKSTTAINLSTATQLMTVTHTVPAGALIRITLHLRGTLNSADGTLEVSAYAAGVLIGAHNKHYAAQGTGNDEVIVFHYTNTATTEKSVAFKITGTTVIPTWSVFTIPAVTNNIPQTQVVIEDLGSLP